jgi:hypothetical protein
MAAGESVRAPVVPGGRRFTIEIEVRRLGGSSAPAELEAYAGSRHLGTWPLDTVGGWRTVAFDGEKWPTNAELIVEVRGGDGPSRGLEVVLDRARLVWD